MKPYKKCTKELYYYSAIDATYNKFEFYEIIF